MTDQRPDPDALLERVRAEEARRGRGALKIFFGYAAGVGKTYSMLEAARRAAAAGREVVVGYVEPDPNGDGHGVYNAAALCRDGGVVANYRKILLPTYDVFDEGRYFDAGREPCVVEIPAGGESVRVGLTICEDLWNDEQFGGRRYYGVDPVERTVSAGAQVLINFLLSPLAQARKQDPRILGGETVLDIKKLDPADRALFEQLPTGVATLTQEELGKPLPEPHPYWMERLEKEWQRRYGVRK